MYEKCQVALQAVRGGIQSNPLITIMVSALYRLQQWEDAAHACSTAKEFWHGGKADFWNPLQLANRLTCNSAGLRLRDDWRRSGGDFSYCSFGHAIRTKSWKNETSKSFRIQIFRRSYAATLWGLWRCHESIWIFEHVRKICSCADVHWHISSDTIVFSQQPAVPLCCFFSCNLFITIISYSNGTFVALE